MKLISIVITFLYSQTLFAQNITSNVSDSEQKRIINTVIAQSDKTYHYLINNNTKVIRSIGGYIKCIGSQSGPTYNMSYVDSFMVNDTSNYWLYNYSDSSGYQVVSLFDNELGPMYLTGGESKLLNDINRYYGLENVFLICLVGVGNCIIHDNDIWILDGNNQTELTSYFKERFDISFFYNKILFHDVSKGDFPFISHD